jgi:hypothetical protein
MQPQKMPDPGPAISVPPVGYLLESLGLDKSYSKKRSGPDPLKQTRTHYKTSSGRAGLELNDWEKDYPDLLDMANSFLDEYGQQYWPDTPDDRPENAQVYRVTINRPLLSKLLAQLFYQQNKNYWGNYRHNKGRGNKLKRAGSSHERKYSNPTISYTTGSNDKLWSSDSRLHKTVSRAIWTDYVITAISVTENIQDSNNNAGHDGDEFCDHNPMSKVSEYNPSDFSTI